MLIVAAAARYNNSELQWSVRDAAAGLSCVVAEVVVKVTQRSYAGEGEGACLGDYIDTAAGCAR